MSIIISQNTRKLAPVILDAGDSEVSLGFPLQAGEDLVVTQTRSAVTTTLALDVDYSVADLDTVPGAKIILSVVALQDDIIEAWGDAPIEREVVFANGGKYNPDQHNAAFEKSRIIEQEHARDIDRSLKVPMNGGDYDAGNNKIINVADGVDDGDAINKGQMDTITGAAPEGTAVKSTGVSAGWFLQAVGDDTSIWALLTGGGDFLADGSIAMTGPFDGGGHDLTNIDDATISGNLGLGAGTALLPSYTFHTDTNTGMYRVSSNTLGITTAGVQRGQISATGWDTKEHSIYMDNTNYWAFNAGNPLLAWDSGDYMLFTRATATYGQLDMLINSAVITSLNSSGFALESGVRINKFSTDGTLTDDSDTTVPTEKAVKTYVDASNTSQVVHKGGYNAATNTPDLDTSPAALNILQGWMYTVTDAGTFFTAGVEVGDVLIADQDAPTAEGHWTIVNKNLDAASIKASYESNADTNEFTDAEKTKLGTVQTNAEFADDVFRIQDDGDTTKEIAFQASAITTGTVRTITMPDADVNLTGLVHLTGAETLTGKTLTAPILHGPVVKTDADTTWTGSEQLEPVTADILDVTLTGNVTTLTSNLADGESVILQVDDGASAYTLADPAGIVWVSDSGSSPALQPTVRTIITYWVRGTTLYGHAANGA